MTTSKKALCVTGASGLLGSNIVKEALAREYIVHGTMRDLSAPDKASFLNALSAAPESLKLFSADMRRKNHSMLRCREPIVNL